MYHTTNECVTGLNMRYMCESVTIDNTWSLNIDNYVYMYFYVNCILYVCSDHYDLVILSNLEFLCSSIFVQMKLFKIWEVLHNVL